MNEAQQELVHILGTLIITRGVILCCGTPGEPHPTGLLNKNHVGLLRPCVGVGNEGEGAIRVGEKGAKLAKQTPGEARAARAWKKRYSEVCVKDTGVILEKDGSIARNN